MNEYMAEKIARSLDSIAKSLTHIEKDLEYLNKTIKPLTDCVQTYPNGHTEFNVSND